MIYGCFMVNFLWKSPNCPVNPNVLPDVTRQTLWVFPVQGEAAELAEASGRWDGGFKLRGHQTWLAAKWPILFGEFSL